MNSTVSALSTVRIRKNSVEASLNASLRRPCSSSSVKTGHEGGAQGGVGEQRAHDVGQLEGDREGAEGARGREVARRDDLAHQAGDAREAGEDREDRRVAGRRPPRRPRGSSGGAMPSARAGALAVGSTDTWGVMLRGAPAASSQRPGRPRQAGGRGREPLHCVAASWPTSIHRRSASSGPSASAWRTAATRRRSRPSSAASRPRSQPATPTRPHDRAPVARAHDRQGRQARRPAPQHRRPQEVPRHARAARRRAQPEPRRHPLT